MKNCNIELLFYSTFLAIVLTLSSVYQLGTVTTVSAVIEDKERITTEDSSKYLVFTDKGVFKNSDALFHGKFSSSDIYGDLQIGESYSIKVYGWRVPFLSMYQNIISVELID